jgi:chloramphenicol 3-O-phosphotransferase
VHALLALMKAGVGYVGIPEHAEYSAEHASLAGIPTPVEALGSLGTYYMTFGGDSERAIEQTRLAIDAARAIGGEYVAVHYRLVCLTYTALLAPGTDETLRLAEDVRHDVEHVGSDALRSMWLQGMAVALLPVDRDRALTLLDEAVDLATQENLRDGNATAEFWRGIVLFTRRRYADAANSWRRALVGYHDGGNRRGMTNVLSGVCGLADRAGRSETAAVVLAGLQAARAEFGLTGSANEREAERAIAEHLGQRLGSDAMVHRSRPLDFEATIDLALVTLEEIAADGSAEVA